MNEEISKLRSELQEVTENFNSRLLLFEARQLYQTGTKFKSMYNGKIRTSTGEFFASENKITVSTPEPEWKLIESNPYVYCDGKWAEIIPEETQAVKIHLSELSKAYQDLIDKLNLLPDPDIKTFTDKSMFPDPPNFSSDGKIEYTPPQSLHDQIREGGWPKVFELAGDEYNPRFEPRQNTKCEGRISPYIRLLALEKVLNEGKKRDRMLFTIISWSGNLTTNESQHSPIGFHTEIDRDFAIDFAEKEFKLFYNHK